MIFLIIWQLVPSGHYPREVAISVTPMPSWSVCFRVQKKIHPSPVLSDGETFSECFDASEPDSRENTKEKTK